MRQTGKPSQEVALEAARVYSKSMVEVESDQLREELSGFWAGQIERLEREIRGIRGVKAFYEGGTMPTKGLDFAKRVALYVDTTIIADPVGSLLLLEPILNPITLIHSLVTCSLDILELNDLILHYSELPPLTIVPDHSFCPDKEIKPVAEQVDKYTISFCSEALGREFKSIQDLKDFVASCGSLEELLKHLTRRELLSDPDRELDPYTCLRTYMVESFRVKARGSYRGLQDPELLTDAFLEFVGGGLSRVNIVLLRSRSDIMKAEPITDFKDFWSFLNWVFRRDSAEWARKLEAKPGSYGIPERKLNANALVLNALMRDDFKWLGNAPVKDIARLREKGELKEIRDMFSDGIRDMGSTEPEELNHVVEQVKDNWNRAVDKHKKEVRKLRVEAGLSASAVIAGTLGATVPIFSPFAIAGTGIGAAKLAWDITRLQEQRKRPVGILLKASKGESVDEGQMVGPPGPY